VLTVEQTEFWSTDQLDPDAVATVSVQDVEEIGKHTLVPEDPLFEFRLENAVVEAGGEKAEYAVDVPVHPEAVSAGGKSDGRDVAVAVCEEAVAVEAEEARRREEPPPPEPSLEGRREVVRPAPDPTRPAKLQFNMARFLRLTGSLDKLEDQGRWYQLPRRLFRACIVLDAKHRITRDFLKDLRKPPQSSPGSRSDQMGGMERLGDLEPAAQAWGRAGYTSRCCLKRCCAACRPGPGA